MNAKNYDLIGITSSALCLLHCSILPLIMVIPVGISHNIYIDLVFLTIGTYPIYKILKNNINIYIKTLITTSFMLMFLSIIIEHFFHIHLYLIHIGSIGLILGHIINFKHHKH